MTPDAKRLVDRIAALIPRYPKIMRFTHPRSLFTIREFTCAGLVVTWAQAVWALDEAKRRQGL